MAGHNKWSKVKNRKGAVDAKRSKIWTKIIREITVASRMGGEDPANNPRLRKALDDGRAANMPKDTVARAISRGAGGQDTTNYEELVYEGYGPRGVALIVECMTDNRNRTSGEVRAVFTKTGGNLGTSGSVMYNFKKKGQLLYDKIQPNQKVITEDALLEVGLEAGASDIADEGESFLVSCEPENFHMVKDTLAKAGFESSSAEVAMVADNLVTLTGDDARTFVKLVDNLEDLDDVQHVWSNADIDEKELEKIMA